MTARVLMIVGSSSSAGKSLLTTALCRIFARRGVRVAPFKAQNMSNNAAVCPDGAEIGRAQAVQAAACGLAPSADMNPILIKPEGDARSQVVVMGKPWTTLQAGAYYLNRDQLWEIVRQALDRLREEYNLVIAEGAGSPAELNLRSGDIVNMEVALYARASVLIVGDIDRGGIFAQLLGTYWLLAEDEQALISGFLVNKFRGDPALFEDGVRILEERSSLPVLGVIPYLHGHRIPEEDAVVLENRPTQQRDERIATPITDIAVIHLPRISNFDDFDPLQAEPGVQVRYVRSLDELGDPAAIILPGTKATCADIEWLQTVGLRSAILAHATRGGAVVGICGGYQMLGRAIHDPLRIESSATTVPGLGLLAIETTFQGQKETSQVAAKLTGGPGWLSGQAGQVVAGYEIHMGSTSSTSQWLTITQRGNAPVDVADGATNSTGEIWGCYLHGLFENPTFRRAWLASLGWDSDPTGGNSEDWFSNALDDLADQVENAIDMEKLEEILWEN